MPHNSLQIHIPTLDDISKAAEEFLPLLDHYHIFALYGGMGAGKTTFINALCHLLGVEDYTGSPSFAIVNEYKISQESRVESLNVQCSMFNAQCSKVYHFDFYRIKSLAEVYDIGYEDYFYSGQPCFIEWPELIEPLLPDDTVSVHITINDDQSRNPLIQLPS